MPKKVKPTRDQYEDFFRNKLVLFVRLTNSEIIEDIIWAKEIRAAELAFLGYTPIPKSKVETSKLPKRTPGFEVGYKFTVTYAIPKKLPKEKDVVFTLYFWSTYDPFKGEARDNDKSKFVVKDSRRKKPIYYSFDIHRTAKYFETCDKYAEALVNKLVHYPCCESCKRPLPLYRRKYKDENGIAREENLFSYFHRICPHCHPEIKKGQKFHVSFYEGMEEKNAKFIARMHKRYHYQRRRNIEKGKNPIPQPFLRAENKKKQEGLHYENVYNDGEAPE